MEKKLKLRLITGIIIIVILSISYVAFLYFMPHRDVQSIDAFVEINASTLVDEYLIDADKANEKYLDSEGESKVIIVKGIIKTIHTDQNNQQVVFLKSNHEHLGVNCTFTNASNLNAITLNIGEEAAIKGVVRSGAEYDEDLDLYEDVIIEKCDVVK